MKNKNYCVIIGDINRSRTLPQRAKIQHRFESAIDTINKEYKNDIVSKFLVTLGDEFQGVLYTASGSYDLIRRFEDLTKGIPFSFGVGIGIISTPIKKDALGMDGEAFYRAREALKEAKHRKRTIYYSFDDTLELLVNALIALIDVQWSRLTKRQKQIAIYLKDHNLSQVEVARRLRISTQAVSKAKNSSAVSELEEAAEALRRFLANYNQPI